MPPGAEEISLLWVPSLFIPAGDGEEVHAPVVILQNDPANVYNAVLENHIHPNYLPQPDRLWKLVRGTLAVDTWRPRVYGVQLKVGFLNT